MPSFHSDPVKLDEFTAALKKVRDEFMRDTILPDPAFKDEVCEINHGWCADFAHAVWEELGRPDCVEIFGDEDLGAESYSHTFIHFAGMYYDAECVEGVDDWTQLPFFHRNNADD